VTWARIDDAILDNPKIARVGPIGFALHVAAITYCARNLTDGFVPFGHAHRILSTRWTVEGDESELPAPPNSTRGPRVWTLAMTSAGLGDDGDDVIEHAIALLLTEDLWAAVAHGYQIHDYLEYNPSREQVLAERAASRRRVQKHRNGISNGVTSPVETDVPVPVTRTKEAKASTPKPPRGDVVQVWQAWLDSTRRTTCKLDEKRTRVIRARLADYPLDDVIDAVRGWERDTWEGRKAQNEITLLLRDAGHLEKFRDLWRQPGVAVASVGDTSRAAAFDDRWAAMIAKGPGPDPRSSVMS
jgi:hypothetical protein